MIVDKLMYKFSKSNTGQKFYKWVCNPNKQSFYNNTLPTIETAVSTGLYCWNTAQRKEIPKDQRNLLQWQNVLGGLAGMGLGSFFNRKATKFVDKVVPKIKPNLVDVHKVKTGLAILLPCVATALTMRLFIPIVSTQISAEIEKRRRAKNKEKPLNVTA